MMHTLNEHKGAFPLPRFIYANFTNPAKFARAARELHEWSLVWCLRVGLACRFELTDLLLVARVCVRTNEDECVVNVVPIFLLADWTSDMSTGVRQAIEDDGHLRIKTAPKELGPSPSPSDMPPGSQGPPVRIEVIDIDDE